MADDSIDIVEPLDFHPCNSPRGMLYYDLKVLTIDQQVQLNLLKREEIRENEKYLAKHPEVRALIALVTRHVLMYRPRTNLHEFVANFFSRPMPDINEEVQRYIDGRQPHISEGDSAVLIREESSEPSSFTVEEEEEEVIDLDVLPREILDEILQQAYTRLGIDTDDTGLKSTVTTSGMSVIKEVISEVLHKAMEGQREDILKYLLKSAMDQQEELDEMSTSIVQVPAPSANASVTDLETGQDTLELEDLTTEEPQLFVAEYSESKQEISEDLTVGFSSEVPQTEETATSVEPTSETTAELGQETTEQPTTEDTGEFNELSTETTTITTLETTIETGNPYPSAVTTSKTA